MLVAEALTARGQVGDDPVATLGAAHAGLGAYRRRGTGACGGNGHA